MGRSFRETRIARLIGMGPMPLWSYFRTRKPQPIRRTRLELEPLEDRCVPATPGSISGVTVLGANGNPDLPGVAITLNGTTDQGTSFNVSTNTDTAGAYAFAPVPTGTYTVTAGPVVSFLGGTGAALSATITVGDAQNVVQNFTFAGAGLAPQFISMKMFTTETTPAAFPIGGAPGAGVTPVDNAPFVSSPIGSVTAAQGGPSQT